MHRPAMAPHRFASMRKSSRPGARVPVPFRDDTTLVAFRYEQTVQAEPPTFVIPVPPRNPARRQSRRPYSPALSSSPVIVVPPAPREQHPALRPRYPYVVAPTDEEWKRDSGLAPTSSSVTIHDDFEDPFIYDKLILADVAPSTYTADESLFSASNCASRCETPDIPADTADADADAEADADADADAACEPSLPLSNKDKDRPASPSSFAKEAGRMLARSLSFRSESSRRRLRKKSFGDKDQLPLGTPPSPKTAQPKMADPGNGAARATATAADRDFTPIDMSIPTESLIDDDDLTSLSFSKRGSIMFGGKRAFPLVPPTERSPGEPAAAAEDLPVADATAAAAAAATVQETPDAPSQTLSVPSIRVTASDVERESEKVRSFYESGDAHDYDEGLSASRRGHLELAGETPSGGQGETVVYAFPWLSCILLNFDPR